MTKWRRQKKPAVVAKSISFVIFTFNVRAWKHMDGHVADQHDHDLLDVASYYCSKQDFFLMEP